MGPVSGRGSNRRPAARARRVVASFVVATLVGVAIAAPASADVIAISVAPTTVARGGQLDVVVTPGVAGDDYSFHGASVVVMRPGLPCPSPGSSPDGDDVVASGSVGPFREDDPPEHVGLTIDKDAPVGTASLCTETWPVALSLAGDSVAGPGASVQIVDPNGSSSPPPDTTTTAGVVAGCALSPHRLDRGDRLRIRCRTAPRRTRVRLHLRCVPAHGRPLLTDRTVRLSLGLGAWRWTASRHTRCRVTVRHGVRAVGAATVTVR